MRPVIPIPAQRTTCPACGGLLAAWRRELSGLDPGDAGAYALARCARCGTAVTLGSPPGPERYETGIYAARRPLMTPVVAEVQRLVDHQVGGLLRSAGVRQRGRVLDAGAGRGRLVGALLRAGYEASGIEPSARGLAGARAAGRPVREGTIENHQDSALDAVVLWHVLEHLADPLGALRRIEGWLVPGGVVLIAVPNLASLQAKLAGARWLHLDLPRHRVHLTPKGLETLAHRAGLRPERTVHMVWEHNPSGMWMALMARLGLGEPGLPFLLLKRALPPTTRRLGAVAIGLSLLAPALGLESLAAALRRGGTLAMVARRRY